MSVTGPPPTPKELLTQTLIAHLGEHGLGDTSLRGLAAAIGTSHRMLSYHFGSRAGLLIDVSREVERQQREAFTAMLDDPDSTPTAVMRSMYERLVDPNLWGHERLFFELYVRALQGERDSGGFLPGVVEDWIEPVSRLYARLGFDADTAVSEARLALAVSRGLLLDLLATEDRRAVDAAMERFVQRYEPASQRGV